MSLSTSSRSALFALVLVGCTPVEVNDAGPDPIVDAGVDAGVLSRPEVEPNDGNTLEETDTLALGERVDGNLDDVSDADLFVMSTTPLTAYRVVLETQGPTGLLTVLDLQDDVAGGDYVQLSRTGGNSAVELEFVAMAPEAIIAVRDTRAVDGEPGAGPSITYTLSVVEIDVAQDVSFPANVDDALAHPGAVKAYRFSASNGDEALFSLATTGDLDGRFFVLSQETGSWIARNDDRANDNVSPLIAAPLFADGEMLLVVDNIAQEAETLSYALDLQLNPE